MAFFALSYNRKLTAHQTANNCNNRHLSGVRNSLRNSFLPHSKAFRVTQVRSLTTTSLYAVKLSYLCDIINLAYIFVHRRPWRVFATQKQQLVFQIKSTKLKMHRVCLQALFKSALRV